MYIIGQKDVEMQTLRNGHKTGRKGGKSLVLEIIMVKYKVRFQIHEHEYHI